MIKPAYTARIVRRNAAGNPVYRVVSDGLQVQYVTIPYKRSDAATVDAVITRALLALVKPPKPLGV